MLNVLRKRDNKVANWSQFIQLVAWFIMKASKCDFRSSYLKLKSDRLSSGPYSIIIHPIVTTLIVVYFFKIVAISVDSR